MSDDQRLVTVLSATNQGAICIAKSWLDDAGIPYVLKNIWIQDLIGIGRMGLNQIVERIEVQVHPKDAETASALLENTVEMQPLRLSWTARVVVLAVYLLDPLTAGIMTIINAARG